MSHPSDSGASAWRGRLAIDLFAHSVESWCGAPSLVITDLSVASCTRRAMLERRMEGGRRHALLRLRCEPCVLKSAVPSYPNAEKEQPPLGWQAIERGSETPGKGCVCSPRIPNPQH